MIRLLFLITGFVFILGFVLGAVFCFIFLSLVLKVLMTEGYKKVK